MYLKKIALAVLGFFILSFASGFIIWCNDLTKHESELQTYIRLAVKDAIINVQTTEQEGLNFTVANARVSQEKYEAYLADLKSSAGKNPAVDETLKTIRTFLNNNNEALRSTKIDGEGLFRPIQFGMTYLDKELFEESFKKSLSNLIEVNYNSDHNISKSFTCYDALHVYTETINFNIDGPYVVPLTDTDDKTKQFLRQLYGIDKASEYIAGYNDALGADSASLGISTNTVPDFYVYYDITVDVPWGSSTAFPFLSKSVWENRGFKNIEYSDPANQDVTDAQRFIRWHSDSTVETYKYRYVLLN